MALQLAPSPLPGYQGPIVSADPAQGFARSRQIFEDISDIPVRQAQRKAETETAKLQTSSAKFENDLLARGATPLDIAYAKQYVQQFGPLPSDPATGQTDWAELRRRGETFAQHKQRLAMQQAEAAGNRFLKVETLDDENKTPTKYALIEKSDGTIHKERLGPDPDAILAREKVSTTATGKAKPLTAEKEIEVRDELTGLKRLEARLLRAQKVVAEGGNNVVGPAAGRAGPLESAGAVAGSVSQSVLGVGGSTAQALQARVNERRELERLSNELTAELTQMLRGPLSEKELAFIKKVPPRTDDDESVWRTYIAEALQLLEERRQTRLRALGEAPQDDNFVSGTAPKQTAPAAQPARGDRIVRDRVTKKLFLQKADGTLVEMPETEAAKFSAPKPNIVPAEVPLSATPVAPEETETIPGTFVIRPRK